MRREIKILMYQPSNRCVLGSFSMETALLLCVLTLKAFIPLTSLKRHCCVCIVSIMRVSFDDSEPWVRCDWRQSASIRNKRETIYIHPWCSSAIVCCLCSKCLFASSLPSPFSKLWPWKKIHPASIILSSFFVSLSVGLCCRFFISVSTVHQPLWAVIIPIQPNIFLSLFNPNTLHKASPSSINIASPSTFPLIFRLIFSQQLPL